MRWFVSSIVNVFKKVWDGFRGIMHAGLYGTITGKSWVKSIIDITLIFLWAALIYLFHTNIWISILGIAMVMVLLNRTVPLHSNSYTADMLSPFVAIGLYVIAVGIYWWVPQITIVAGMLMIPCVTLEISNNYKEYYDGGESIC